MFRAIASGAAVYALLLVVGSLWPTLAGLPLRADHAFPVSARFMGEVIPMTPMRKILARFGVPEDEMNVGHPLVFGDQTPDGGFQIQLLDRGVEPAGWRQRMRDGGAAIDPQAGPVQTFYPEGDVRFTGAIATRARSRNNYPLEFEVVDRLLTMKKPQRCTELEFGGNLFLTLALAHPNNVVYCMARSEQTAKKAVLSFYAVDNGFLTRFYTSLRCTLIHDAIADALGAGVMGLQHVCMEFRADTFLVHEANPITLRHLLFAEPG